jgi:hypothetical protein
MGIICKKCKKFKPIVQRSFAYNTNTEKDAQIFVEEVEDFSACSVESEGVSSSA